MSAAEEKDADPNGPDLESAVELTADEETHIRDQMPHRAPVLFEIIRRNGQEELERPLQSLWWSGMVAGLSIGFSVLTPAMLQRYLPQGGWSPIISMLGYSVGFVIVILSRQQLFTENVITAVVPVMAKSHLRNLLLMLRLWAVVLIANVVGAALFAVFLRHSGAIEPELAKAIHEVCAHLADSVPMETMPRAMVSGFLIASLVWILAGIEGSGLAIIVLMTYLIALGGFDHVVAGTVEAAYLVLDGSMRFGDAVTRFFLPTLVGNVVGGTVVFTLLAYGQIRGELKGAEREMPTPDDDSSKASPRTKAGAAPARPRNR
ncbi:MAG: formate/nitrite transporter family protein [Burkholderiaceae bacterium]